MKVILKTAVLIFSVLVLTTAGGMLFLTKGLETMSAVAVREINPTKFPDGVYSGKFNSGRWSNEVSVTVKNSQIAQISLQKDVLIPKPEVAGTLFRRVIEKQSTNVDTVSGATITSKAYLKSIENSLENSPF